MEFQINSETPFLLLVFFFLLVELLNNHKMKILSFIPYIGKFDTEKRVLTKCLNPFTKWQCHQVFAKFVIYDTTRYIHWFLSNSSSRLKQVPALPKTEQGYQIQYHLQLFL